MAVTETAEDRKTARVRNRWRTRRQLTLIAFFFTLAVFSYVVFFVPVADVNSYLGLVNALLTFTGAIVGAYVGFATYDDVKSAQSERGGGPSG